MMSDELVWKQRKKGEYNWRARNQADDGTYVVYMMDWQGTSHINGVLVPDSRTGLIIDSIDLYSCNSGVGSLAEAKDAAQAHHYAACRARRWADYMLTNEPPVLS